MIFYWNLISFTISNGSFINSPTVQTSLHTYLFVMNIPGNIIHKRRSSLMEQFPDKAFPSYIAPAPAATYNPHKAEFSKNNHVSYNTRR